MQAPDLTAATAPPAVETTRWLATGCALALIALGLAWELWLAPLRADSSLASRASLAALRALPFALAVPGLWRRRMYTYRWVSLLVWLYCLEGLVTATSESGPRVPLAALEVLLAVVLFIACALHVRLRLRSRTAP